MNDEVDRRRFAEIPDPFVDAQTHPVRPLNPKRMVHSPTRSQVYALRWTAAAFAVLLDAAWLAFVQRRSDLGSLSPSQLGLGLAIPLGAMVLTLSALGRRGQRGLGESKGRVLALSIASPALFAAATLLVAHADISDGRFWHDVVGCILVTAILAGVPLMVGAIAFRRAFVAAAAWRMCSLGIASGALAAATMSIACPVSTAAHLLVGHGAMMLFAGAVGAVLGERVGRA